jgi:poly-gamma-glutamate capsule biosynthesis protein CapA/YwtB (metallophosphatase superfamily)
MKHGFPTRAGSKPALIIILILFAICLSSCQTKARAVTLALLGDLMFGRGVNPQSDSLAYLKPDLSAADLALANLESPLAPLLPASDPSTYNLCASSTRASLLPAWGIDLVSLANNHRLDCVLSGGSNEVSAEDEVLAQNAVEGPLQTRSALEAVGITAIGPGMEPVIREVNGLHLVFLAFDDVSSPLDENAAVQAIRSARDAGALVVVSIHWGPEYQGGASVRQKSLAQEFAQAGAALVWGHHPHVLQPAAWIGAQPCEDSKPSQGCTLVLYSLGNALFDQGGLDDTRQSALVVVTLDSEGVTSVRTVPFEIDVLNSRVIQPDAATAEKIRDRLSLP